MSTHLSHVNLRCQLRSRYVDRETDKMKGLVLLFLLLFFLLRRLNVGNTNANNCPVFPKQISLKTSYQAFVVVLLLSWVGGRGEKDAAG